MQKLILVFIFLQLQPKFTLMLDPAGDSEHAGRILQDCYERGATLQFCNQLKSSIEQCLDIRVIITRAPGEPPSEPLQNANFCNRLSTDLYLSVHFYNEKDIIPKIWIYYFKNETVLGNSLKKTLVFYPYDKVWTINFSASKNYALLFESYFKKNPEHKYDVMTPKAIPFKPLIGISVPSLAFEIGLKNSQDSEKLIKSIVECMSYAIHH